MRWIAGACGHAYLDDVEFGQLIRQALETTKKTLHRDFAVDPEQIALRQPSRPMAIKGEPATVATWQIVVPVDPTRRSPKSRINIEFANVPSYDSGPNVARVAQGLVQVQDVILTVETANEILADKAVALTARNAMKYRDVWDVWYLINKLNAQADRAIVTRKFADYGTSAVEAKARQRREHLVKHSIAKPFLDELTRFLPAKRVAQMREAGLHQAMLAASRELIERVVLH